MGDEIIGNRWDSSTGFLIAMIGAIIGLSGNFLILCMKMVEEHFLYHIF